MSARKDLAKLLSRLDAVDDDIRDEVRKGVDAFAQMVIGNAQERAPVDTGYLADSGKAEPARMTFRSISARLGFNSAYAAAVHEAVDANFNTQRNPDAQAKFLESAMSEAAPKLMPFLAKRVEAAIARRSGGGGGA